jgi:hypothetical protein
MKFQRPNDSENKIMKWRLTVGMKSIVVADGGKLFHDEQQLLEECGR